MSSVTLDDSHLGQEYTQTLSWNTSTSGAYVIRNTSTGAFQAGTFTGTPPITYTVTPSAGSNGTVSPNTIQTVISGLSATFTATPNGGYAVYQWLLNGVVAQTGGTSFTASSVTNNSTVRVTFQALTSPVITSSSVTTFAVGKPGTYIVSASGYPQPIIASSDLPSWLSLNGGVLTGTPTQSDASGSPYTIHLTADNGSPPSATEVLTVNVLPAANFSTWETNNNFAGNATVTGMTATPYNDGTPNLLKYLYDIDPTTPMGTTDYAALPVADTATSGQTQYLTLTFRQNPTQTGITINVQTSTNLQTWTTVPHPTMTQTGSDATTGDPIMQAQVPVSGATQFIRLNITSP